MGKQAQHNKLSGKNGVLLEQNTIVDDNLLPAAEELSRLNDIDPKIIPWIMERTAIEQDARIKFNNDRLKIANRDMKSTRRYNVTALIFGFIVLLAGMAFSVYLIMYNLSTEGTLFAGSTIVIASIFFIKASKNKEVNNN